MAPFCLRTISSEYWNHSCDDPSIVVTGAFFACKFEHSTYSSRHGHSLLFHILSISLSQTSHSPAQTSHIHKVGIRPGFLAHSSGNTTSLSYPQTAQRTFMANHTQRPTMVMGSPQHLGMRPVPLFIDARWHVSHLHRRIIANAPAFGIFYKSISGLATVANTTVCCTHRYP